MPDDFAETGRLLPEDLTVRYKRNMYIRTISVYT